MPDNNNDKKISELPSTGLLDGQEIVPVVQGGLTKATTVQSIIDAVPVQSVNGFVGDIVLDKSHIGLSNVNNTSDLSKPISTATQNALDLKANASSLAAVATSGSFSDLINKPAILCLSFGGGTNHFTAIAGTSYIVAASFYFPGTTKLGTPTKMYAIVSNASSGITSNIRIYNPLTSQVIAEYIGFSGTAVQLIDLGSLANIPSNPTTLEIQMQRTAGSGQSRCHSLTMYR